MDADKGDIWTPGVIHAVVNKECFDEVVGEWVDIHVDCGNHEVRTKVCSSI